MEPRDLAVAHARGRMVVGAAFVLAPGLAARLWVGSAADGAGLSRALDEPVPAGEVSAPEAAITGHH